MKKQMTILIAAVLCTSLLAGCGASGKPAGEKQENPQESSVDAYAQMLAEWEEKNEEIIKTDPLVEEISQMLIEESQSTEPVDVSAEENLIRFTVKSESEAIDLLQRMAEKTNGKSDRLLAHMKESGIEYPNIEIVWKRATGMSAQTFALES